MRNKIVNLLERKQLTVKHLPLPPSEEEALRATFASVVQKLVDPTVFEFEWEDCGIWIDLSERTHYPEPDFSELMDAATHPVPHEKMLIETKVPRASGEIDIFMWYIERTVHGYVAAPMVFRERERELSNFGIFLDFDRRYLAENGLPVFSHRCPPSHTALYSEEELSDHHRIILRFLRILCLPGVAIAEITPDPELNRARARRRRSSLSGRKVVRIAPEAIRIRAALARNPDQQPRGPVASHHRRAHVRRLASGRSVHVRNCIINETDVGPAPQQFQVRNPL